MCYQIRIPDEILRKGYWYILQNPNGDVEELDKIHPDLAEYLVREGVISI